MKVLHCLLLMLAVGFILFSCAQQKTAEQREIELQSEKIMNSGRQYYLAYNLWYDNPRKIEAINFKMLPKVLGAGKPVEKVVLAYEALDDETTHIRFCIKGEEQIYRLYFSDRYQKNENGRLTYRELMVRTFTPMTFDEITNDLTQAEINNIKHGTIQKGMSKKAVLISWGFPPLMATLSLDDSRWTYWKKRVPHIYVDFNDKDNILKSTWYGVGGNSDDGIE